MLQLVIKATMCFISTALSFIGKALFVLVAVHIYAYWVDRYDLRRYPGPFLAKFSYLWLVWTGWTLRRSQILHEMHRKYGVFFGYASPYGAVPQSTRFSPQVQ